MSSSSAGSGARNNMCLGLSDRRGERGGERNGSSGVGVGEEEEGGGKDGRQRYSPELEELLSRLRPFQREAFDFAVHGAAAAAKRTEEGTGSKADGRRGRRVRADGEGEGDGGGGRGGRSEGGGGGGAGGDGRLLLADEMGLGKTVTSLAIMTYYRPSWPLLVLCPASLRHSWPAEIEKFLPSLPASAVYVVSGFDDADFYRNRNKRDRIRIVVATYSLLQNRSAAARVLDEFGFRCVIADESHNLKERNSQRCKLAMPILRKAERLVLLSGTPALARPVELWAQVHCLAPKEFGTYSAYTKMYCNARRGRFGWDVTGLSNADELHDKLRGVMVRRLKSDVLSELPPKQRSVVPVRIGKDADAKCREVMEELRSTRIAVDKLVGSDAADANFEARRLLMEAYQAGGIGKAPAVAEYLLDWLAGSGTQKVLVFGHHREVLDILEGAVSRKYKGVGHVRIDGSVPPAERAVRVRKFQSNPLVRAAILSVTAAGVGLTLTAASSVIFAELHWTPGVLAQAEDRCHRIGQLNAVNVTYCVCRETELSVDTSLWAMLGRKVGALGRVIDGNKSASMNAREADGARPIGGGGNDDSGGMSAEDELTAFFAGTSPSASNSESTGEPARGSIQSFFLKMGKGKKRVCGGIDDGGVGTARKKSKKSIGTHRGKSGTGDDEGGAGYCPGVTTSATLSGPATPMAAAAVRRSFSSSPPPSPPDTASWSCRLCTFINEGGARRRSATTSPPPPTSCQMCGTPKKEREGAAAWVASSAEAGSGKDDDRGGGGGAKCPELEPLGSEGEKCRTPASLQHLQMSDFVIVDICNDPVSGSNAGGSGNVGSKSAVVSEPEVICIDDGKADSRTSSPNPGDNDSGTGSESETEGESLSFAVSKNSGRISLHSAGTGRSLEVNFDVEQVVTDSTNDALLETRAKRTTGRGRRGDVLPRQVVEFDMRAVRDVVKSIGDGVADCKADPIRLCEEVCRFIRLFLSLREVEKKAFMEGGKATPASQLRRTVAELFTSKATATAFDRYGGSSKDRALENSRNNVATERDEAVLRGDACAWCGADLPHGTSRARGGVESTYCSRQCAEEGRVKRGHGLRERVFALERGVCQKCGVDAQALFLRIRALRPAERLSALCGSNWRLPQKGPAVERLLQRPREGDFWQADHIRPVSEGGGQCGMDNLRTLCTPCHMVETEKLRARLRLNGGGVQDSGNGAQSSEEKERCQMDIRTAFSGVPRSGGAKPNKRKRRRTAD